MRRIDTRRYLVRPRRRVNLARLDPADTGAIATRKRGVALLRKSQARLYSLAEMLYAQNRWSLLLVFQAMDGAGKDGAIKHVMRGLDPKSTTVHSFGQPSNGERAHDYMWRCLKALPERGKIGVFNRSYYEEVLVVRVHPELLEAEQLPRERITKTIWKERYEDIRNIEQYLSRNGTIIRKFYLNLSKSEQRHRFLARLDDPAKKWKFSSSDIAERRRWPDYMKAYGDAIAETSTHYAPWYIIPANQKWFTRLAVAEVIIEALESLRLHFPPVTRRKRRELAKARRQLRGGRRRTK